jgi:hypothetical protein
MRYRLDCVAKALTLATANVGDTALKSDTLS